MLPQFLFSSYEQYKADTDFVASWLVNTATQHGYVVPRSPSETLPKPARLKGRARKLAREAKASSSADVGRHDAVTRVYLRDFVPLAQFIAESTEPRIEVSAAFETRLKRAIRRRRQHHDWHDKHNKRPGTTGIEDGHGYFIGILEQVQALLQPSLASEIDHEMTFKDDFDDRDFSNRFHMLTPKDTVEVFDHDEIHNEVQDELNSTKNVKVVNDLSTSKDEAFISAVYLFKDIHMIRIFVRHLWELYATGQIDLVAASVTTNTAIDFVRNLQEDFEATFVDLIQLNNTCCLYCAFQVETGAPSGPIDYVQERCLVYAQKILSTYLRDLIEDSSDYVPTVAPQYLELYDRMADRMGMTMKERVFQDFKIAMGVIPELAVLLRGFGGVQAEHEVLRGLRELTRRKEPVFWLTFALQVFLDIRHVLRENVALAFTDLRHGADLITKNIKEFLDFHDKSAFFTHLDTNSRALKQVLDLVGRWTQVDTVGETRREFQLDPLSSNHIPEFYLLARDPLWCGLLLYNFRTVAYEGAIITSNMCSSVVAAAHVHNCLQQEKIITQQWTDMDTVLSTHGVKGIFIGDQPHSSNKEYASRYALALGISPVSLARNPRKSHVKLSAHKRRTLQRQAPVYWIFKNRYCDNSGQVNFEPRDIEEILLRGAKAAGGSVKSKSKQGTNVYYLLSRLADALHRETLEVTFDYFQMHTVCWGILRRLGLELGPQMAAHSDFGSDDSDLLSLVFLLLSDGVAASQKKLLLDAGQTFASILASDGGRLTAKRTAFLGESIMRRCSVSHGRSNGTDT